MSTNANTTTTPSGLQIEDTIVGDGAEAKSGHDVTVHYTGWLTDGKKFDSSRDRDEAFTFIQGKRQVIAGWDAGFEGMSVGGKRRLIIPYQMAYGEKGRGAIPPRAELIFDVELLGVEEVIPQAAGQDLLNTFDIASLKFANLSKAIPEDKLDWRPAPGVRSIREVILHAAYGNKLLTWAAKENPSAGLLNLRVQEHDKLEHELPSKDKAIEILTDSIEAVRQQLTPLRAGSLDREQKVFGQPSTARGYYILIDSHLSEHLGQLIAYARMNGIAPPWSQQQ